jgi:hypothetical protein
MSMTAGDGPEVVICRFQVRSDCEDAFRTVLGTHWPALRDAGLVTADAPQQLRGLDAHGQPIWIEIFTWNDGASAGAAHSHPVISKIWDAMEPCVEDREGPFRKWDFPHYKRVDL